MCHAQVDLRLNNLGEEGWCAIFDALRDNPQNKIAKWNLYGQGINPTISKSLAAYMAVSASLTSVSLLGNKFDNESASMLLKVKEEKPALITLCGLMPDQTQVDFSNRGLGPPDAMLLAPEMALDSPRVGCVCWPPWESLS